MRFFFHWLAIFLIQGCSVLRAQVDKAETVGGGGWEISPTSQHIYRGSSEEEFQHEMLTNEDDKAFVIRPEKDPKRPQGARVGFTFQVGQLIAGEKLRLSVKIKSVGDATPRLQMRIVDEHNRTVYLRRWANWHSQDGQVLLVEGLPNENKNYTVYVFSQSEKTILAIDQVMMSSYQAHNQIAWQPQIGMTWDIQFEDEENIKYRKSILAYDIDLFDTSKAYIQTMKEKGHRIICYFSVGTWEKWRDDASDFPSDVVGKSMPGWAGEKYVDVSKTAELMKIMNARFDLAVKKGCDAVDLDNMDTYTHKNTGFSMNKADQLRYNIELAKSAHQRGLAVGLKNAVELVADLVDHFDFTINEECFDYQECHMLRPFVAQGKPVLGVQYQGSEEDFCPKANKESFDFLKKGPGYDLGNYRVDCRNY